MDSWPADCRIQDFIHAKRTEKESGITEDYPHLEHGALGSLTLCERGERFEWTSILKNSGTRLLAKGKPVNVFPVTRPPPLQLPHTTITQRSEQGANFLRIHFPDVDIASELIRDEIAADARISRKLEAFDPQVGSQFEVVHCQDSSSRHSAFLAFPMGELNRDLNISPYSYTQGRRSVFKPSGIAIRTFETPIQQIVSSNLSVGLSANFEQKGEYLAVRDFTSTSFFEVMGNYDGSLESASSVQLTEVAKFHPSDVGSRPMVDVNLSYSTLGTGLLVNQIGSVYRYDLNVGGSKPRLVHATEAASDDMAEGCLWKLASMTSGNGCLLASNRLVKLLDFRTASCLNLFSVKNGLTTFIESPRNDHIFRLVSTSEILWVDERSPRKPLLSFKHGRRFDRSLGLQTVDLTTPLTFLTSRENGLVTVYDVSRSDDRLIQVNVSPYALPSVLGHNETNAGHIVFRHPSDRNRTKLCLLQLCKQGSIHALDLVLSANEDDHDSVTGYNSRDVEWSEDVKELHRLSAKLRPHIGSLGTRNVSEVDLRALYEKLFILGGNAPEWGKEKDPEAVYEILEKMPLFWQDSDGQADAMLTLFDIAFRSGEEPTDISRADFLTQCAINSTRGYRALIQGRIPLTPLIERAAWYFDIRPIIAQHIEYSEDPRTFVDNLHRYDLTYADPCPQILRRESQAREQLALDLALSTHIFSPQSFTTPPDPDTLDTMSRATEAMSLSDEPPAVQFGYLRPIPKPVSEDLGTSLAERLTSPLGVRLLLKEWEIGTDPLDFVFHDPYDGSSNTDCVARPNATGTTSRAVHVPTMVKTRLPPMVVASNTFQPVTVQPESFTQIPLITRSQGSSFPKHSVDHNESTDLESEIGGSQVYMTSTQILPGPYGGRQPLGKKKPAKKRIGGF